MSFHALKAEPMVRSSYPTHPRFQGDLEPLLVVLTVPGMERADWDTRAEKLCWILALPEVVFMNGRKFHYQVGFTWESGQGAWFYRDCPVRDLLGAWEYVDGYHRLGSFREEERPRVGVQGADIYADDLGVHYTVRARNLSDEVWLDACFAVCLNHFQAPLTGYRPHFRFGDRWQPFQEIPGATAACYFPVRDRVEEFNRSLLSKPAASLKQPLSFPGVVCWNQTLEDKPLLVCHVSEDALSVGANQLWPCTDLQLWFGDIEPGEEVSRSGHVLVMESDLAAFAREADGILARLKI